MNKKVSKKIVLICSLILVMSMNIFAQDNSEHIAELLKAIDLDVYETPIPAADFTLTGINGESITLAALDDDLILLNFWATWCGNCNYESPFKNDLWKALKDYEDGKGFEMIAANYKETEEVVTTYMNDHQYSYPVYLDNDGSVYDTYQVPGVPMSYIIIDGMVIAEQVGRKEWSDPNVIEILTYIIDLINPPQLDFIVSTSKPVYASGQYSSEYAKELINDGDNNTAWGVLFDGTPEWVYIDLGKSMPLTRTTINWVGKNYACHYAVAVSENALDWDIIDDIEICGGGDMEHEIGRDARYVGLYLKDGYNGAFAIPEFSVYACCEEPRFNVSEKKPATASHEYSSQYSAEAVNDGNDLTAWGTLYTGNPEWVTIDLGMKYPLQQAIIKFYDPYFACTYKIEGSVDGVTWTTMAAAEHCIGDGGEDRFYITGEAQYVRLYLEMASGSAFGVKEFQLFSCCN